MKNIFLLIIYFILTSSGFCQNLYVISGDTNKLTAHHLCNPPQRIEHVDFGQTIYSVDVDNDGNDDFNFNCKNTVTMPGAGNRCHSIITKQIIVL